MPNGRWGGGGDLGMPVCTLSHRIWWLRWGLETLYRQSWKLSPIRSKLPNYSNPTGPLYFVFCRLYPFSPQLPGHCFVLPVISLLLTNIVSPPVRLRACLSSWLERFRGTQKEDERGPLSIHSLCSNFSRKDGPIFVLCPCEVHCLPFFPPPSLAGCPPPWFRPPAPPPPSPPCTAT